MSAIDAMNNLDYQVYKNLWVEFWINKLGYNPPDRKMSIRIISLKQARGRRRNGKGICKIL